MNPKTLEQTRLFTQMVAQKQGWALNPEASFYETLVAGLMTNFKPIWLFPLPLLGFRWLPRS